MTFSHFKTALPSLLGSLLLARLLPSALLASVCVLSCSGTETDNPVAGGAPIDYHSPIRFEPDPPGDPGCPAPLDDAPPRLPLWGRTGNYLVGIDVVGSLPRRGLVVLDVSDPAAPAVVAEQPLAGYPRQLLVEGSSATLVIDEFAIFDTPPVPAPAQLEAQTKLVRFDLSTPSAPRRSAELPLPDEFWELSARADGYWVLSGHIDPATQACDATPNLCGYITRDAMFLTHYTWSGTGWLTAERVELPAGPRAWLTETGVATATSAPGTPGKLSFAVFGEDGSLGPVQTLPLAEGVVDRSPLYIDSQRVGLFSYDLTDGTAAFSLLALNGTELGRVGQLSQGLGEGTHFVPGGVLVNSGFYSGQPGSYIDFSDPGALRQVALPQASGFLPLAVPGTSATRALGWTQGPGFATNFTLWSLGSAGPTLLDSLPTTLPAPQSSGDLELIDDQVVVSVGGAGAQRVSASLRWANDTLSLRGPIPGGYGDQHLAVGDWLYEPDSVGLRAGNPSQGSVQTQAWDEGSALDVSAVPGGEARLTLDATRGAQLFVTRGGLTQSIAVAPGAQRLLPAGERLMVLSPRSSQQCSQSGLDCSNYAPNVAIVELAPLRIVSELPLPQLPVPELSELSQVEQRWDDSAADRAPVRLGEHTWLLESEYSATCRTEPDCQALGLDYVPIGQARVNPSQASCGPGVASCPQPPAPTVYGEATRRMFYVLDATAASLSDPLAVDGARGTPYTLWTRPVFTHDTLLDLHLSPSAYPPGDSRPPTSSAFLLERYVLNAAGGLEALPVINIPGYPVALLDDGQLLTLEPDAKRQGSAQLHRLELRGDRAHLRASRALQARAGSVTVVGQTAVYLRDAADACAPTSRLESFALDAELTPGTSLELPGDGWRVVGSDADSVVLQSGRGFIRVVVDQQGNLLLASFATTPGPAYRVQVEGGEVHAIVGNQFLRLAL